MSSYIDQVKKEIEKITCDTLFVASDLKKTCLSDIPDSAYYKILERMVKDEELVHLTKGMYYRPKKEKDVIIPMSQEHIVEYFMAENAGVFVGNSLLERKGIAKKNGSVISILSNNLREEKKDIGNIKIQKLNLCLDFDTKTMIETLEILQAFPKIENVNKNRFLAYMKRFAEQYSDKTASYVIENRKYKKSTIAFLERLLTWYGVENSLNKYLSPLSKYKIPTIDELRATVPAEIEIRLNEYVKELQKIYRLHLNNVILYGSYARGDYDEDSDIDIMILLGISELEIKKYRHQLAELTYAFNETYDLDIKPIAKSKEEFLKWVEAYPFYANINREGVDLYGIA